MRSHQSNSDLAYSLTIQSAMDIPQKEWDQFIEKSPQGSLYARYEYLSLIRQDWQAYIISDAKGTWCAVMPVWIKKKWSFTSLSQPLYTQYWGICFRPFTERAGRMLHLKKEWSQLIIQALAPIHLFAINFSPVFDYAIPFHWAGYQIHTRYTFILDLGPTPQELEQGMSSNLKRKIKQAKKAGLQARSVKDPQQLLRLMHLNREQGHDIVGPGDASYDMLRDLSDYLLRTHQGHLLEVQTESGEAIAVGLFARYQQKYLYLAGCQAPEHKQTGAHALLMWEAIRQAKASGVELFDFEGSMLEGVEEFFRKFGAQPVPYLQIRRNRLPLPIRWIHGST